MSKTKALTQCALFTALLCVISPIVVPLGTIPLTFSLFVIMLSSVIIGPIKSAVAAVIYLLVGSCGLPVFSHFSGGVGVLFSLTGGYLLSYPLVALVCGIKFKAKTLLTQTVYSFLTCLLSLLICHTFGTLWYMLLSHNTLTVSLKTTVFLFLPFDILKAALASILGVQIKDVLKKSRLF